MSLSAEPWLRYRRKLISVGFQLLTSLVVALGGLFFGWLVYRKVMSPAEGLAANPAAEEQIVF